MMRIAFILIVGELIFKKVVIREIVYYYGNNYDIYNKKNLLLKFINTFDDVEIIILIIKKNIEFVIIDFDLNYFYFYLNF